MNQQKDFFGNAIDFDKRYMLTVDFVDFVERRGRQLQPRDFEKYVICQGFELLPENAHRFLMQFVMAAHVLQAIPKLQDENPKSSLAFFVGLAALMLDVPVPTITQTMREGGIRKLAKAVYALQCDGRCRAFVLAYVSVETHVRLLKAANLQRKCIGDVAGELIGIGEARSILEQHVLGSGGRSDANNN